MTLGFKQRPKKEKTARKRTREEDDTAELDVADEQTLQTIEELLEDQKLRAKLRTLESRDGSKPAKQFKRGDAAAATMETQYGLHDPKKDGGTNQKLMKLLDGQFTGQTSTSEKDQHEELMNQFIEERLQAKLGVKSTQKKQQEAPVMSEEDALFAVPDHLKPDVPTSQTEDADSGGVLIWNTGIAEVELPSTYKEKTARATQMALERDQAAAIRTVVSSALPTNFSTDFNRHRNDYVAELKSMNKDEKRERGFRTVGKNQSSDDLAVSRFRKFESRKKFK